MEFKERSIPFKKILQYLLHKWKLILLAGLVIAVFFSGAKYLSAMQDYRSAVRDAGVDSSVEELKAALSESELTVANDILYLNDSANDLQDYLERSVLMSVDPYEKHVLTFQYEVKCTENDPSVIMMAYRDSVYSGSISKRLLNSGSVDVAEKYLNELISISLDDTAYRDSSDRQNGTFILTLCGESVDWLNNISDDVRVAMDDLSTTMQDALGAHSLTLVSSEIKTIYDENLASVQQSKYTQLKDMKTQLESECESLSLGQKRYIFSVCPDQKLFALDADNIKPGFAKKNVVYGFLLGVILMALMICFKLLFSGKILSVDELCSYDVPVVSSVKCDLNHSGDFEERTKCISRNISLLCRSRNVKNLCVVDMGLSKNSLALSEKILQCTDQIDLTINEARFDGMGLLLDSVENADAVLLLIEERFTTYHDLENTLAFLTLHKIDLIGSVVFVV